MKGPGGVASGHSGVFAISRKITNAQVLAGTTVEVVPACKAGYYIQVLAGTYNVGGTINYTNPGSVGLFYGDPANNDLADTAALLSSVFDFGTSWPTIGPDDSANVTAHINGAAVNFGQSAGAMTGGDGDIIISIAYIILPLSE